MSGPVGILSNPMRIVCISDTHERHEEIAVPPGDILIHAGDMTWQGERKPIEDFNAWLGTLPHRHKIVVAGNHDFGLWRQADLYEPPLDKFGRNAVEKFFTQTEIRALLDLTEKLAA